MLGPIAIDKERPLAFLAHDLRRVTNDSRPRGRLPVRLPWTDGSAPPSVFVAAVGGGLGGRSGELAQGRPSCTDFLRGTKQVSSAPLTVTRLTFVSGLLV
jgi:hypothetical protein